MFKRKKEAQWSPSKFQYNYTNKFLANVYELKNGSGRLNLIYESHLYDFTAETLLYDNIRYFSMFMPDGGCYETAVKWIRRLNKENLPFKKVPPKRLDTPESVQKNYHEILKHLISDKYQFERVKVELTDGVGNCFWKTGNKEYYEISGWTSHIGLIKETFIYNTEHPQNINWEQVNYYRKKLCDGELLEPGLGIHVGNNMIFLLDGHHRAFASLLETKDFYVWRVRALGVNNRILSKNDFEVWKNDEKPYPVYEWPEEVIKQVRAMPTLHMLGSQDDEFEQFSPIFKSWVENIINKQFDSGLKIFLDTTYKMVTHAEFIEMINYYQFVESAVIAQKYLQFMIDYPITEDKSLKIYHEIMTAYLIKFPELI